MVETVKREREDVLDSVTLRCKTGCDNLYVVFTWDKDGPMEVFAYLGMAGQCDNCMLEAITRAITNSLRRGIGLDTFIKPLQGITCPKPVPFPREDRALSCSDAIATCIKKFMEGEYWKSDSTMERKNSEA